MTSIKMTCHLSKHFLVRGSHGLDEVQKVKVEINGRRRLVTKSVDQAVCAVVAEILHVICDRNLLDQTVVTIASRTQMNAPFELGNFLDAEKCHGASNGRPRMKHVIIDLVVIGRGKSNP